MPGQIYSDKYIKDRRGAEKDKDRLEQAKLAAGQATSEAREARRRFAREREKAYQDSAALPVTGDGHDET